MFLLETFSAIAALVIQLRWLLFKENNKLQTIVQQLPTPRVPYCADKTSHSKKNLRADKWICLARKNTINNSATDALGLNYQKRNYATTEKNAQVAQQVYSFQCTLELGGY